MINAAISFIKTLKKKHLKQSKFELDLRLTKSSTNSYQQSTIVTKKSLKMSVKDLYRKGVVTNVELSFWTQIP